MIDTFRSIAPPFLKALYQKSKYAVRTVAHAFDPTITCKVRGMDIKVGVSSELEHCRAETFSSKEPETLDWLDQNLTDGDVFMDVGANIGLYSLYAAKLKPTSTVYSFEPESQNFGRLCRNIVLNALPNIVPCNFPLCDREGFDWFYVGTIQAGAALHSLGALSDFRNQTHGVGLKQGAFAVTLDTLVGKCGVPQPALLKVDVDGIEEKILDGGEAVLRGERLRTILVEVSWKDSVAESWSERKLARFGYRLVRKSAWVAELNGLRSQNYIFSRQ